jgi:hypothetical protein
VHNSPAVPTFSSRFVGSDAPCILVVIRREARFFDVASYDEIQRQRYDQPLWARGVPPVEELTCVPANYDAQVIDPAEYAKQMRRLLGLE